MTYLEQRWKSGRQTAGDARTARGVPTSMVGRGLYETPQNTGESDFYRPRPVGNFNLEQMLSGWDRRELVEFSRQLFCHLGNFGYAVLQKNTYAVGDAWLPQYLGQDKEWGNAAETWLHETWLPNCDWHGQFDFATLLYLSGVAWDVDGDDADLLALDESGFPKIRKFSTDRICGGLSGEKIKSGRFDGALLDDGVIHDDQGRVLGYRIMTRGSAYLNSSDYLEVDAANLHLGFEPEWGCQRRGIPRPARAIMDGLDLEDIDKFIKRGIKQETSIGLVHNSEAGQPEPGAELEGIPTDEDATVAKAGVAVRKLYGGEMWYLRAGLGESISAVNSGRPHGQTLAQLERLERRMFNSLGWFYELLDPSKIGGASVRLIQDQARTSIASKQRALKRRAKREVLFALSVAMERGWVPRNRAGFDWMQWEFNYPAVLTVDQGYDDQSDVNKMMLGIIPKNRLCQKMGLWNEDVDAAQLDEKKRLITNARELQVAANAAAKDPGDKITLRECIDLLYRDTQQGRYPYSTPAAPEAAAGGEAAGKGSGGEKEKESAGAGAGAPIHLNVDARGPQAALRRFTIARDAQGRMIGVQET